MKTVKYIICFFSAFLAVACSDIKGTKYGSPEESPGITPQLGSFFPHTDEWNPPTGHGRFVLNFGISPCESACHGENLEGGTARGCITCHTNYPHPPAAEWQGIAGHGKYAMDKGVQNCATNCHGTDLAGGFDPMNKKSCTKCHISYPQQHADQGWKTKGHGQFVKQVGNSTECSTMCHRPGVPTELKLKDCGDCHSGYSKPHQEAGWKKKHGEFLLNYGGVASSDCTTCHGPNLEGGSSGIACVNSTCHHSGGSEGADWKDKKGHGTVAISNISTCLLCHGNDLKGNAVVFGCDKCHHKNWADTHGGIAWKGKSQHGAKGKQPAEDCKLCHGKELDGGLSGVACSSCHDYPHEWVEIHHGADVLTDNDGFSIQSYSSECQFCHSELYPLNIYWPSGPESTVSGTARCYKCHPAYPHYEYEHKNGTIFNWAGDINTHMYYLFNNQSFTSNNPDAKDNVTSYCGGNSPGFCHNNTRHQKDMEWETGMCNVLCHSPKP